jgi:AraC-like DNA-binding protein
MDMHTYLEIGAALSQVMLTAVLLLAGHLKTISRTLFGLLLFGTLCYLLFPLAEDWPGRWVLGAGSTLVPGVFWLFCASVFDDHYEFPPWQPVLVALSVVLPTIHTLAALPAGGWANWLLVDLPQGLEFIFLGLALYAIFINWQDDLVPVRRTLRLWFCSSIGVSILLIIAARELLFEGAPWLDHAQYLATALVAGGTNILLLRFRPGVLDPIRRHYPASAAAPESVAASGPATELPKPLAASPKVDPDLMLELDSITRLVEQNKLHREWGITIGKLAGKAGMPEHRLRRLINSGLGYRNFNDFMNQYRIEEAALRLADPAEARIPVLTIALEAGFRSISSFNKAFKDLHQVTPTAFRKQSGGQQSH